MPKALDIFELMSAGKETQVLALVRKSPATVNKHNANGSSVLMAAAFFGLPKLAKHLIAAGVNVNEARRKDRYTALMFAAEQGYPDLVSLLLDANADVARETTGSHTAWTLAYTRKHAKVLALLRPKFAAAAQRNALGKALADGNVELAISLATSTHKTETTRAAAWAASNNVPSLIAALTAAGVKVPRPAAGPERLTYAETTAYLKERGLLAAVKRWWPSGFSGKTAIVYRSSQRMRRMRLDYSFFIDGKKSPQVDAGIIVDGDLRIDHELQNGEQDFGPFLIVAGGLTVANAAIGGAPIHVAGDLRVTGAFHGYYNHGTLSVGGATHAALFIADDYSATFGGKVRGNILRSTGYVKSKSKLPPEPAIEDVLRPAFYDLEEGEDTATLDSGAIYKALTKGTRITR